MPTASAMAMVPMMVDTRDGDKNGSTPHDDGAGAGEGEFPPTSDSTLRTTPTSLTCFETTESQRQVIQRRPTRALTPPQVRRRPSVTDELEEAVRFLTPNIYACAYLYVLAEGRGYAGYAANLAHGRTIALSTTGVRHAPERRTRAHLPLAHSRRWSWSIRVRAVRWSI
jgi:hypothetical protein